jgi:DNA-binding NtrC family response regulator
VKRNLSALNSQHTRALKKRTKRNLQRIQATLDAGIEAAVETPVVRITISGPQGTGKTKIAEFLHAVAPFINLRGNTLYKTINVIIIEETTE